MSFGGDDLPKDYDAIVLGTGMTECIVAAALSRIGQKVLHLDRNDYYSGDWGTFHFKGIQEWIESQQGVSEEDRLKAKEVDLASLLEEGERTIKLQINAESVSNVVQHTYIKESIDPPKQGESTSISKDIGENNGQDENKTNDEKAADQTADNNTSEQLEGSTSCSLSMQKANENESRDKDPEEAATLEAPKEANTSEETEKCVEWTIEKLNKEFRKFNIDLHPRVLFSRGPMVELLISSDIAKYCEFRTVTRVLTNLDDKLEQVPCSRSDVFSSKQVSMIEKRMLMKLLTFCLDYEKQPEQYAGFEDKTFCEFLKSKKLTKNVSHYVQHSIAMVPDSASTIEGLKSTQKFLQSLGRYGNTAFLWPLYGSGELPQCFCRMCAVFGGTYCLRRTGAELIINAENKCLGIVDTEGVRLNSKWIVAESSYLTSHLPKEQDMDSTISRGILFTNKSILEDKAEHISLLSIPADGDENIVTVLELSSSSLACPKDIYMVHLSCKGRRTAEDDLQSVMKLLFQSTDNEIEDKEYARPKILWSLFFNQKDTSKTTTGNGVPGNMFVLDGPNLDLDFDYCIEKAKAVFDCICPGEEFLPKAPNPEDIIFDDGAAASNEGSGFEADQQGAEQTVQSIQSETVCEEEKSIQSETKEESESENT